MYDAPRVKAVNKTKSVLIVEKPDSKQIHNKVNDKILNKVEGARKGGEEEVQF